MPLYETNLVETVGNADSGNILIRGEYLSACAFLKKRIDAGEMQPIDLVYGMHDDPGDSLALDTIGSMDDIENFRRRPHPMRRYCDNDKLTVAPWRRSELAADEWLA